MPLSCSCPDNDDAAYWVQSPYDYSTMPARKRRVRCSCGVVLNEGDVVARFPRSREARTDVEIAIYGEGDWEAITLAPRYLCERCADLYFSLEELGFKCINPSENMRDLVKEYAEIQRENRHAQSR